YVSDFFDEEEEIERIVMEKGKKASPEETKREANEQIDLSRIEREKQMEAVQEIAEPMKDAPHERPIIEAPTPDVEPLVSEAAQSEPAPKIQAKGRGRKGRNFRTIEEPAEQPVPSFEFEMDDSGFERVKDDDDTGEIFKDAYVQEAIVDRV